MKSGSAGYARFKSKKPKPECRIFSAQKNPSDLAVSSNFAIVIVFCAFRLYTVQMSTGMHTSDLGNVRHGQNGKPESVR